MARVWCACDFHKSHLSSGKALICFGGGGHICCTRCAPHGRCPFHPDFRLRTIELDAVRFDSSVKRRQSTEVLHIFRNGQLSLSAIENVLKEDPRLVAPRGAAGPVFDCTRGIRCDRLQLAKTSTYPECIAITFTQNIPIQKCRRMGFTTIGTIWPGSNHVEMWPKMSISNSVCLEGHPFIISTAEVVPLFPEDLDGDVFGLPTSIIQSALQNPCVWSRMPWLNKRRGASDATGSLSIKAMRRQQPRVCGKEIVVNGSVIYCSLQDNEMDFLCAICGRLQRKSAFFSTGCGVGAVHCLP